MGHTVIKIRKNDRFFRKIKIDGIKTGETKFNFNFFLLLLKFSFFATLTDLNGVFLSKMFIMFQFRNLKI